MEWVAKRFHPPTHESTMSNASKGPGSTYLDAIFQKSSKQLRGAAKACRVNKGGVACAVLDLAAAVIDNAKELTAMPGLAEAGGDDAPLADAAPAAKAAATAAKAGEVQAENAPAEKKPAAPPEGK